MSIMRRSGCVRRPCTKCTGIFKVTDVASRCSVSCNTTMPAKKIIAKRIRMKKIFLRKKKVTQVFKKDCWYFEKVTGIFMKANLDDQETSPAEKHRMPEAHA